jgi:hypothetical protein
MAHMRLHIQQADGHLPMVCMRCGAPATVVKTKKMSWYPRWIIVFLLLGLIGIVISGILALVLRKRARLQAPFCEHHQGHWTMRTVIAWVATILANAIAVGSIASFIALENARPRQPAADILLPWLCVGSIGIFVVWLLVIAILQNTAIRPEEITRTHILLNGVSEEFVNAVEEAEIERRVRLRQWEYEDEAEEMPHRPAVDKSGTSDRPPSSDAFEEKARRRSAPPPPDAFEA